MTCLHAVGLMAYTTNYSEKLMYFTDMARFVFLVFVAVFIVAVVGDMDDEKTKDVDFDKRESALQELSNWLAEKRGGKINKYFCKSPFWYECIEHYKYIDRDIGI